MSSNNTLVLAWNTLSVELNRYVGLLVYLFGVFGNSLNILVLCRRPLRTNPCSLLFLASSVSNLTALLFGLTSRILSGWNVDPTESTVVLCKLRILITFPARTAAFWLIMLAAVDRWLLSSVRAHYRRMSTLKNAQRGIVCIAVLSFILFIHAPICYELNSDNTPLQCYSRSRLCRLSIDLTYSFVTIGMPIILMNVFSFKTLSNLRESTQRVHPWDVHNHSRSTGRTTASNRKWKTRDQRLMMMLYVQIICFTVLTFPVVIHRIYSTTTMNYAKSDAQIALESFVYNLALLTSYCSCGIPFYVYTLTGGKTFRKALYHTLHCKY